MSQIQRRILKGMKSFLSDDKRWRALVKRDPEALGAFYYGVLTTGVYCRAGCRSRLPKQENVRFFNTCDQAQKAGFRPCRRCRPDIPVGNPLRVKAVLEACRFIEKAESPPSLQELADQAGLSRFYFQRLFKKIVGITPKQYALEKRSNRMREHLQKKKTVTEAVYQVGFASSSRFYEKAADILGMKPAAYQNGAPKQAIRFVVAPSRLGLVLVAATDKGICAIEFGHSPEALQEQLRRCFPKAEFQEPDPHFKAMIQQVLAFLESPRQERFDLPLDIQGTAFQRQVWLALQKIPSGSTASYKEIATRIGRPQAARAVAQACAANPVAVAIPCHRVVRRNGKLGGYRWGIERKRKLLSREQAGK
ncbi:MAG: bifunctional DNA-binding transcriptional regulator/O6-methylguanine-DNA methyltransferase Ada [Desulfobacteraceae bacterium]|nr:MAG: bifunctional DNA-binding transcriptional regulator/O6-methylguanine-DNA methyltransferase Ada [Desulfobacteraceae bacterium]